MKKFRELATDYEIIENEQGHLKLVHIDDNIRMYISDRLRMYKSVII